MISLLVVDDHKPTRDLLSRYFSCKDYQVYTAANLDAVQQLMLVAHIDIAIVDIRLEGSSQGLDVLSYLKAQDYTIVVIITTAYAPAIKGRSVSIKDKALRRGADDFIEKSRDFCVQVAVSIDKHLSHKTILPTLGSADFVEIQASRDQEIPDFSNNTLVNSVMGIPDQLNRELNEVLLTCGSFDNNDNVRVLFVNSRIHPWRNNLPDANSSGERIKKVIDYLYDKYNAGGENALVLFLQVLKDAINIDDACFCSLSVMIEKLSYLNRIL